MSRTSLFYALATVVLLIAIFALWPRTNPQVAAISPSETQVTTAIASLASTSPKATGPKTSASSTTLVRQATTTPSKKAATKPQNPPTASSTNQIARIQNPYSSAPLSFDTINANARAAVVNILCQPRGGSLSPVSGSGVIIDPRGVILTNAHMAQYVLLSADQQINLSCTIRTGSPARDAYIANVLFIPPVWVQAHYADINATHPTGTGEHDYALLYITSSATTAPLPSSYPSIQPDTRAAIGFPGDSVLIASYPAEFVGGTAAETDLYSLSSVSTIKQLLTFSSGSADALSLGGVLEAQGGSSGGAIVNAWGRLIGLIVTTSEAPNTADRDLHALTLNYIDQDLAAQSGKNLQVFLSGDPLSEAQQFSIQSAPALLQEYLSILNK